MFDLPKVELAGGFALILPIGFSGDPLDYGVLNTLLIELFFYMVGIFNDWPLGDWLLDLLLAKNDESLPNGLALLSLLFKFIFLFSNCSSTSSSVTWAEPLDISLNVANAFTRAFACELFIPSAPRPSPKLPVKYPGSGCFYLSKKSNSNLGVAFYPLNLIALKFTLDLSSRSNSSLSSLIS